MLLYSNKDWLDGIKLLDFQCNLLQTENRFNNFIFSYYNRINPDTKAILTSEDYFKEKINNLAFYGLSKEFFKEVYIQPKQIGWVRSLHFLSYPLFALHYAIGIYLHRLTNQRQIDNKIPKFQTFYGGNLKSILEAGIQWDNAKKNLLRRNDYQEFATTVRWFNTNYNERLIIKLDIQNFFEDASINILLENINSYCKHSDIMKNGFLECKSEISFFYKFLGNGTDWIPQGEGNFISSYISNLYMHFGDMIIDDILKGRLNLWLIKDYSVVRYIDDTYIIVDLQDKTNYTSIIANIITELSESFYNKLNLRFNNKVDLFDLSKSDDIEEFNDSIKMVSGEETEIEISNENNTPAEKLEKMLEALSYIKNISVRNAIKWLSYEHKESIKFIYDKNINNLCNRPEIKERISAIIDDDFDLELLKLTGKPLLVIGAKVQNIFNRIKEYCQRLEDSYWKSYLLVNIYTIDKDSAYLELLKFTREYWKLINYWVFDWTIESQVLYNNQDIHKKVLWHSAYDNLLQQIKLKNYYKLKKEYGVAFNHLQNEFHLCCYIAESPSCDIKKYDIQEVLKRCETISLSREDKNFIRKLFDRRNNSPISHPWTERNITLPIDANEYSKYESYIVALILKIHQII